VTVHPLQAFSRRYFGGRERLFSYSEDLRNAAVLAGTGRREPEPFIVDALPHPEEDFHAIELESLLRFYRNPARHLLRERLNIRLETAEEEIEAREPFELAPLANYGLKQRLLKVGLRDEAEDVIALERAAGVLPHGRMGEIMFERERDAVARFVARVAPALRAQKLDPIAFDIEVGTVRLTGVLQDPSPDGLLAFRAANVTANDRVSAWIRHLVLNIVAPKGVALETRCIGQDRILTFGPVKTARATLEALIDLYFQGLRRPLHFFPRSASVYAEVGEINSRVRNVWEGSPRSEDPTGERDNPYFRLAFRGLQPLDQEFERTARIVFEPMRDALTEETLG